MYEGLTDWIAKLHIPTIEDEQHTAMIGKREDIIELLREVIDLQRERGMVPLYGFTISMPCGQEAQFINESDIPESDLPCPCGDPGHYLMKITRQN